MNEQVDAEERRVLDVYAERTKQDGDAYAWWQADVQIQWFRHAQALARALQAAGRQDLSSQRILDLGCGRGAFLRRLVGWGANPRQLHGFDLQEGRITAARAIGPADIDFRVASGFRIPLDPGSVDVVYLGTVLSSILDLTYWDKMATEIGRVLAPGGDLLVFDMRYRSPRNPNVRPVTPALLRGCFSGWTLRYQSLNLVPPLARKIRWCPTLTLLLESVPFLRGHCMYHLRRSESCDV
jgi:ubiquinone/menaquinone biosynthesis C-methylase UbiE